MDQVENGKKIGIGFFIRLFVPFALAFFMSCLLRTINSVLSPTFIETFNMSASDNYLNIIVRNSIKNSVISNNQNFITTKKNKSGHGYGMKTIKFITEKYSGTTDFYEEGNIFVAHIVIYQK